LYWYFQQNQCLNIKNYAVYNIHRLAWGISQLVVETLKGNNIAQEGIYSLYNSIADNFKEYDLDT
jgi:hypothetical protein